MKREYPEAPVVGVGAVIVDRERVLLIKRGREPLKGEWSIPGGVLELGETTFEGLKREVFEETLLDVHPVRLLGVYDRIVRDSEGRVFYHYLLIDYLCSKVSGEARAASDCDYAQWFTKNELGTISLPEDTGEVIRLGMQSWIGARAHL